MDDKDRRIAELEKALRHDDDWREWDRGRKRFTPQEMEAHDLAIRTDERKALLSKIHIKWACSSEQGFRKWFVQLLQDDFRKARASAKEGVE